MKNINTQPDKNKVMESLKLFSRLVERCFGDCVNDFYSKTLTAKEVSGKVTMSSYTLTRISFNFTLTDHMHILLRNKIRPA